jgi:hypothetical protein
MLISPIMSDYTELGMNAGNEMADRLSKVGNMPQAGTKSMYF